MNFALYVLKLMCPVLIYNSVNINLPSTRKPHSGQSAHNWIAPILSDERDYFRDLMCKVLKHKNKYKCP